MTAQPTEEQSTKLLETRGLTVEFKRRRQAPFRAVDGVDLFVGRGETLGVVGESGSGKSTIAKAILGLVHAAEGTVWFEGQDITRAGYKERRRLSSDLQAVFQDPYSQLSPTRTIGDTLAEPVRVHENVGRDEIRERVARMLSSVGLSADAVDRYPAHFSGGQRQRIAIARALMLLPKLVVCDEPTSALDLSVQAQVLNLLTDLQERLGVSYLFVSHDLAVVRLNAHRVVVLYRGQVMESGPVEVVCVTPRHPYTQALLDAAPIPNVKEQRERRLARIAKAAASTGPKVEGTDDGCPFAGRCAYATELCRTVRPVQEPTASGAMVACHHWRAIAGQAPTSTPSTGDVVGHLR